ncbi:MAG: hypothetical protein ACFFEV_03950, partial [Candidatus Thorarchaeota archaeon]
MILDEHSRLERFRRVAKIKGISPPEESMLPFREVEYLRGLLNANVYLEAEPWMCPSWVTLSLKSIDVEKELITDFRNTLYRNWSSIGGVGTKQYGVVSSRGLVVPRLDFGSIDLWPLDGKDLVFPALIGKDGPQMKLVSTEDQLYEWKTQIESVEIARLLYHVMKDNAEFLYNEIVLRNLGLEETTCTFYVVIRPMSPLGVEPIETTEYDTSRQTVYINGNLALMVNKKPTASIMCEGNDPNIPQIVVDVTAQSDIKYKSLLGLATTVLRFDIPLPPAGSERIFLGSPLFEVTKKD